MKKIKKIATGIVSVFALATGITGITASASYDYPNTTDSHSYGFTGSYNVPRTHSDDDYNPTYTVTATFKLESTNKCSTTVSGIYSDTLIAYVSETNGSGTTKTKGPTENGASSSITVTVNPILFTPVKSMHIGYTSQLDHKWIDKYGY